MGRIPPELIDNIIDFLHDEPDTLRECCTVSSTWVASSRYHLFSHVTLTYHRNYLAPSAVTACHRLYQVVKGTPEITQYIKHIIIYDCFSRDVNEDPSLPLLLRALTSLQSLEINPDHFVRAFNEWSEEFLEAIAFAISSKSFYKLRINASALEHPVSVLQMLRSCNELKILHLTGIYFSPWLQSLPPNFLIAQTGSDSLQSPAKRKIHALSLDHPAIAGGLLHPLSAIDVSNVRDLTIKIRGEFSGVDTRLLGATPLVKRLEVILTKDIGDESFLDLSRNPELKYLIIKVPVLLDSFDPLPWLFALFSSIPTVNSLKEIVLTATIDLPPPQLTPSVYQDSLDGWKRIDSLLVDPKFSALQRIQLDFPFDNSFGDEIVPAIIDDILFQFQKLDTRGILYADTCEIGW